MAERQFTVLTLGTDFWRDVAGTGVVTLSDGKQVMVEWEEATQNFVIVDYEETEPEEEVIPPAVDCNAFRGNWSMDTPDSTILRCDLSISACRRL